MNFLYDGISLQNGRETNMDSLLLTEREISGTKAFLGVVCDGVGSMNDGAYAGVEAVRLLNEWFIYLSDIQRIGLRLRDEILLINSKITEAAKEQNFRTATTLSALLSVNGYIYIVHAGDSRIYSADTGSLKLLTVDAVTESGQLVTYIGNGNDIDLFYSEFQKFNGIYLLCSDGLYKRVKDDFIYKNVNTSNKKMIHKSLISLANTAVKKGERDNISIAIIKIS